MYSSHLFLTRPCFRPEFITGKNFASNDDKYTYLPMDAKNSRPFKLDAEKFRIWKAFA